MKRGIKISWAYDHRDHSVLQIIKKRGKLTFEEVEDLLRYDSGQKFCGHYAVLLNCSEETIGGNGLFLEEDSRGDAVDLYPIQDGETCPLCGSYTPPFEYCPSCGASWKNADQDVKSMFKDMREETMRMIKEAETPADRAARYWSYIGALDMAHRLGFIKGTRRDALYKEAEDLKELLME